MKRMFTQILRGLRDLRRKEDGNATIEFAILFPAFIMIFLSAFESGLLMTRQVLLDRAVDLTVRDLRLRTWLPGPPPTHEELRQQICNRTAIIPDCMNSVLIEMRPVDRSTWTPLNVNATCIDKSQPITGQLPPNFNSGVDDDLMLVRVCAVFDPIFPMSDLGLKLARASTGDYALVASSIFVNEPAS